MYLYLRKAMEMCIDMVAKCAPNIILVCHSKDSAVNNSDFFSVEIPDFFYSKKDKPRNLEKANFIFKPHNGFDASLNADLTKADRTDREHSAANTALQQRLRIFAFVRVVQRADHAFIAGKLNIAAEARIRSPHERIEPINAKENKAQHFP